MIPGRACLLAIALHAAALVAIGAMQLEDELPPLAERRPRGCVFLMPGAEFSRLSLLQGATREDVGRALGARMGGVARDACVRLAYGPRAGLTVLFRDDAVRHIWVTEAASVPDACPGSRVSTLAIAARPWYPSTVGSAAPTRGWPPSS